MRRHHAPSMAKMHWSAKTPVVHGESDHGPLRCFIVRPRLRQRVSSHFFFLPPSGEILSSHFLPNFFSSFVVVVVAEKEEKPSLLRSSLVSSGRDLKHLHEGIILSE